MVEQSLIDRLTRRMKLAQSEGDLHKDEFQYGLAAGLHEAIMELQEQRGEDAVKAGVSELHDAVNAYHSAQPAVSAGIEDVRSE